MGRTAFVVSSVALIGALGCGGHENGTTAGTSGNLGASANMNVSDGGAADVAPHEHACSGGLLSCQGLQPQTCVDGQWQDSGDPCPYACSDGACTGVCVPKSFGPCMGNYFETCGPDGQWGHPLGACDVFPPASCEAGTGSCAGEAASDSESASDAGDSDVEAPCPGGCLCFSTPETCPSNCARSHRSDGTFVCGYACDAPGVPCNCVYHPNDGGVYICDSFTMPACPAVTSGACDFPQGACMTCGGFAGPAECGCTDAGLFAGDAGVVWQCIGTEEACRGP